jgi:hypothetical protein
MERAKITKNITVNEIVLLIIILNTPLISILTTFLRKKDENLPDNVQMRLLPFMKRLNKSFVLS